MFSINFRGPSYEETASGKRHPRCNRHDHYGTCCRYAYESPARVSFRAGVFKLGDQPVNASIQGYFNVERPTGAVRTSFALLFPREIDRDLISC